MSAPRVLGTVAVHGPCPLGSRSIHHQHVNLTPRQVRATAHTAGPAAMSTTDNGPRGKRPHGACPPFRPGPSLREDAPRVRTPPVGARPSGSPP
ncbi:hypothetical protein SGM_1871 [Streptomyces griseoaurantiacus M045]|uniref:Uncharacterized protein n=1 Tax=Streptomyces griseoaurantiacus M045 TaxID=996637 RepID=F3NFH2_9ACTN|nr:hypothetical protein SGM_1871 [Streptomyces griseoaurantiacus M045]